jgi:hypothetical protein
VVHFVPRSAARADPTWGGRRGQESGCSGVPVARNEEYAMKNKSLAARYFFTFFFPSLGMHLWKKGLKSGWFEEGKVLLQPGMGVGCFQKGVKPMFLSGQNCPFFGSKTSFILAFPFYLSILPFHFTFPF